jgi:TonB family protein
MPPARRPLEDTPTRRTRLVDEGLSLLGGAAFTLALFLSVAKFAGGTSSVQAEPEELRLVSSIEEPPPPEPQLQTPTEAVSIPLTGIEIHAVADSAVKVSVVPPDLDKIIPPDDLPPKATIQFDQIITDLKPKSAIGNLEHIYQQNEVDQAPSAVVKTIAAVPHRVREDVTELKVVLLLIIETDGGVSGIRIFKTSGNAQFDAIVLDCVRDEWVFSPAVKKGRKVRCMVQQTVWYKWTESKFTV